MGPIIQSLFSDLRAFGLGKGGTSSTMGYGGPGTLSQFNTRLFERWNGLSIAVRLDQH